MNKLIILLILFFVCLFLQAESDMEILSGAERSELYLELLKNKEVGLVGNHTSLAYGKHLVDYLLEMNINITAIFSPEHGFRGNSGAGILIEDGKDSQTGIPIYSLYGANKKPDAKFLQGLDIIVFDLQDVGTRFYTYISTLHYVMQACAEEGIPVLLLDRPNPNGNYIDGPVLQPGFESFVGLHPVPVVYGMTIGEYALMINGESWLGEHLICDLTVIPCKGYTHSTMFSLSVAPSPNLPNNVSVRLYPLLCFFEGTKISVGRGTDFPFQVYGHPFLNKGDFYFTPESRPGFSLKPKQMGENCRGEDLRDFNTDQIESLNLDYLLFAYQHFPDKENFFTSYFSLLAGTDKLRIQIEQGMGQTEIQASWEEDLNKFKSKRKKYLLYDE